MGKALTTQSYTYKGPLTTQSAASSAQFPFQVTVSGDQVSVSAFSYLLEDFDVRNNIFILGLGYPFTIKYGEKIYLETVFDSSGQVAYARIDHEPFWPIYQNPPKGQNGSDKIQIYPSTIANLTSNDVDQYGTYLSDQLTRIQAQQQDHLQYLQDQVDQDNQNGNTEQAQQDQDLLTRTKKAYDAATTKLRAMQNKQTQFFGSIPNNGIVRKQVACYNIIANTTQDDSGELNPITVTVDTSNGQSSDDGVDTYSLTQGVSTDLMLVDMFYQYTQCRYPIPWSRPVYYFLDPDNSGKSEDEENTDPDNS